MEGSLCYKDFIPNRKFLLTLVFLLMTSPKTTLSFTRTAMLCRQVPASGAWTVLGFFTPRVGRMYFYLCLIILTCRFYFIGLNLLYVSNLGSLIPHISSLLLLWLLTFWVTGKNDEAESYGALLNTFFQTDSNHSECSSVAVKLHYSALSISHFSVKSKGGWICYRLVKI